MRAQSRAAEKPCPAAPGAAAALATRYWAGSGRRTSGASNYPVAGSSADMGRRRQRARLAERTGRVISRATSRTDSRPVGSYLRACPRFANGSCTAGGYVTGRALSAAPRREYARRGGSTCHSRGLARCAPRGGFPRHKVVIAETRKTPAVGRVQRAFTRSSTSTSLNRYPSTQ
jgi:hypothetical protein